MNALQRVFDYRWQKVRTIIRDGEPWWVLKDVCDILSLGSPHKVAERLDEDEKGRNQIPTPGGNQEVAIINESGLYNVVLRSDKPEAKPFKTWITHEVVPAIRKTGSYSVTEQYYIPKTYSDALRLAADAIEESSRLRPKAEMHDLFLSAGNDQPMAAVAKSIGIGRNKLFKFLREKKVLRYNNEPYQEFIDRNYFKVVEKPIVKGDVVENITQTFVTAKGVDYIGRLISGMVKEEAI